MDYDILVGGSVDTTLGNGQMRLADELVLGDVPDEESFSIIENNRRIVGNGQWMVVYGLQIQAVCQLDVLPRRGINFEQFQRGQR